MEGYLTRAVFEEHQKHVDQRFDSLDARFDRLEQIVREDADHTHNEHVRWGAFITILISAAGIFAAVVGGMP